MLSINVSEVIWTVICFFVLLFVLKKFLFGPLIKLMDERQARIDAGEAIRRESEQRVEDNAAQLEESWKAHNDEMRALQEKSRADAEAERVKTVAAARQTAHEAEKESRDRLQAEREDVLAQTEEKMPELVGVLSDRLIHVAKKQ